MLNKNLERPEFGTFESVKSMMRNTPPNGTADFG
jgi:hypothetical protein